MAEVLTHNQIQKSPQDALLHYGVKGMKWGVTNKDRPSGAQSGAKEEAPPKINVKKAERHEQNAANLQKQIDSIQSKSSKWAYVQTHRESQVRELTSYRDVELKAAADVRAGNLTDGQKTAIKGLAIAGGVLAAYGAYKFVDSGQFNQTKMNLQERRSNGDSPWKKNDRLKNLSGEADIYNGVVKQINPDFGALGTKMNCRRCTFAYEMRRRGYDVQATKSAAATGQTVAGLLNATTPNSNLRTGRLGIFTELMKEASSEQRPLFDALNSGGWGKDSIKDPSFFASSTPTKKSNAIFSALGKQPDGARGELSVGWTMGGGHSMAYEIIRGKPVIFDTQTGKTYNSPKAFETFAQNVTASGFTRLDKLVLNDEYLKRWLRNVD